MIVYETCVLFFKMVADLRTWNDNCVDDQVWEHITSTLNARTGKAFTKRGVIRKFKAI